MWKYFFIISLIFSPLLFFYGCYDSNNCDCEKSIIKINDVEFDSLAEAISVADAGETILVYNDVNEVEHDTYLNRKVNDKIYTVYEIEKPITIKGVDIDGSKPKVYGSFIINLNDSKYQDCHITIENLDITHDYVSLTDPIANELFSSAIRVLDGSLNLVDNNIHMAKSIHDEIIENNDLPLFYGLTMSRPIESENKEKSYTYDIKWNTFGLYSNIKDDVYSSAFRMLENNDEFGKFSPAKINASINNYSLAIYNNNSFDTENNIMAINMDIDNNKIVSIVTNNQNCIDYEMIKNKDSKILLLSDLCFDEVVNIDLYGLIVVNGDVKNCVFNLKNKEAKIVILGDKLSNVKINEL